MQDTRQHILEILKQTGQATVDDIVAELCKRRGEKITAVTVRHHLKHLQQDELISEPRLRHRSTPGRPQHVYALTAKAEAHFPNNFQRLATGLITQLQEQLPDETINVIFEGVADEMAAEAHVKGLDATQRIDRVVNYLNEHGYNASIEKVDDGYILHTRNCPYHQLAHTTDALCSMDIRLISSLLGVVPRLLSRVSEGDKSCAYMIPLHEETTPSEETD